MGTIHITNMEKAGLTKEEYENPEYLADKFIGFWEESGKGRKAGIVVCVSIDGCYHAHIACYGNTTTLKKVADILFNAHIEPQLGGKDALKSYLLKEGKYEEKGEQVLCVKGINVIQDNQGKRNDLDEIEELLNNGATPEEIFETSFRYRKYEKMIKSAYIDKRIKETPLIKESHNEWHVGNSGSGKTYYYYQLCEKCSPEKVYMTTDFENGGFDFYIEQGAPPIIFLDEFKGNMRYGQLLTILDKYSRTQTHCRYANTYNLWTTCIITSIFPPDEVYSSMVEYEKRNRDKIDQLLRRLDVIVYHYKKNGEYKTFSIPANEYIDYDYLKQCAFGDENGLVEMDNVEDVPFDD
ncbi:MAG: hypothetical protein KIC67_17965 [Clostridium butyricum]|nr:hypothetical protein [Clostridium butyricum]